MGRSLGLSLALISVVLLASCGGASPTPADPRATVTSGIEATLGAHTFHLAATVDGTLNVAETGGTITLDGTTLEGDVDIDRGRTHLTFAVPALMGISGEVITIGADDYLKTSVTGSGWVHSQATAGDPLSDVTDPNAALTAIEDLMDAAGVTLVAMDRTDCSAGPCSHVAMTIPADQLQGAADLAGGLVPSAAFADGLVLDLYFSTSDGRLAEVSTGIDSASVGSLTLGVTFSAWDQALIIEAPPASDIQQGTGLPF